MNMKPGPRIFTEIYMNAETRNGKKNAKGLQKRILRIIIGTPLNRTK